MRFSSHPRTTLERMPENRVSNTSAQESVCFLISLQNVLSVCKFFWEHADSKMKVSSSSHSSSSHIPVQSQKLGKSASRKNYQATEFHVSKTSPNIQFKSSKPMLKFPHHCTEQGENRLDRYAVPTTTISCMKRQLSFAKANGN